MNHARESAAKVKAKHYAGEPCRVCAETLRYVSNDICVACNKKRTAARVAGTLERNRHIQPGATFDGTPCGQCGATLRFQKNRCCVACNRARAEKDRKRPHRHSPEYRRSVRDSGLLKRYGVTSEYVDALLVSQGGVCAICKTDKPNGAFGWNLDHCHDTGEIRGVLCMKCNCALGGFGDSVEMLRAAIEYIDGDLRDARNFFVRESSWLLSHVLRERDE